MIKCLDILTTILSIFSGTLFFVILGRLLPLRGSRPVRAAAWVMGVWLCDVIIYSNDLPALFGTMLAMGVYLLMFYKGQLLEKLSVLLVFYPIVVAVNYLMQDIGSRFFFSLARKGNEEVVWDYETLLLSTGIHTGTYILRLLFWAGVFLFVKRFLQGKVPSLPAKMWCLVDALLLAPMVAIFTIVYFMPNEIAVVYPICLASVFSGIGSMYLAAYIYNSLQTAYRMEEMEKQRQYHEDLLKEEERVRSIYHDMKNHLLILEAQTKDSQIAHQSLRELQSQISDYEDYLYTGNKSLDVILRDKAGKARQKGIDFGAAVCFEDGDFIEPLDISTIFGNALDNAIEASEKLPEEERMITLKTDRVRDMIVILVENNAKPDKSSGKGTSKKDNFLHGFGLVNIQKTVEKYGGQCNTGLKEGRFVLKIVIPLPC